MSASVPDHQAVLLASAPAPRGAYPHAHRAGDLVFVSGTSSRRPDGTIAGACLAADGQLQTDIAVQTRVVIESIGRILDAVGSSLSDLVQVTTYLVDMDDFDGYNAAYAQFFDTESGPTRTTVAVDELPHPHLAIEIQAIAFSPSPDDRKPTHAPTLDRSLR